MNKLKKYFFATAGFVVLMSGLLLSGANTGHSAVPTDKDVIVINTPSQAVPTIAQGTTNVSVTNTPTVKAQQNGLWNVGITGTPTVQVGNSESSPVLVRDVDRPTSQPFQAEVQVTLGDGQGGQNGFISVPTGKLFVIEQVSAQGTTPAGQRARFSILTHVAPDLVSRTHLLQTSKENEGSNDFFMASQQVRIYADAPGPLLRATRDFTTGTASFTFVVSGYFVDK